MYHRISRAICKNQAAKIFIVGMPRCGSTLIESILSVNSNVVGLGETNSLFKVIDFLSSGDSGRLNEVVDIDSIYLENKRAEANSIFLDKNLYNFAFLSWLPFLMPESRVIHVRRHRWIAFCPFIAHISLPVGLRTRLRWLIQRDY